MSFRRKKTGLLDLAAQEPAVRKSICTGEMTAGYLDRNGRFHDLTVVQNQKELEAFFRELGVTEIKTVY